MNEQFKAIFEKNLRGEPLSAEEAQHLNAPENKAMFYELAKSNGITSTDALSKLILNARGTDERLSAEGARKRDATAIDSFNLGEGLNMARNVAQGAKQIKEGDRTLHDLEKNKPAYGEGLQVSPYLKSRIADAKIKAETGLSGGVKGELNRENLATYTQSLDNAKAVGGGQGSTFAALSQQAALDKMRANLAVAGLDQKTRLANTEAYDQLLPIEQGVRTAQAHQADMRFNNLTLPAYNGKLRTANQLAQTGRANVGDALAMMPAMAGRLTREYYPGQRLHVLDEKPYIPDITPLAPRRFSPAPRPLPRYSPRF